MTESKTFKRKLDPVAQDKEERSAKIQKKFYIISEESIPLLKERLVKGKITKEEYATSIAQGICNEMSLFNNSDKKEVETIILKYVLDLLEGGTPYIASVDRPKYREYLSEEEEANMRGYLVSKNKRVFDECMEIAKDWRRSEYYKSTWSPEWADAIIGDDEDALSQPVWIVYRCVKFISEEGDGEFGRYELNCCVEAMIKVLGSTDTIFALSQILEVACLDDLQFDLVCNMIVKATIFKNKSLFRNFSLRTPRLAYSYIIGNI